MGTDIHISIEVLDRKTGLWEEVAYQCTPWPHQIKEGKTRIPTYPTAPKIFRERNYSLFQILAHVRANEQSFPAIFDADLCERTEWLRLSFDTSEPIIPRLPDPYDAAWHDEDGPRWMGDHSFGWVTLEELQAYDWDGTKVKDPYGKEWTAREATGDWPGKVIPWLRKLAKKRPLRLLMGFDS